MQSASAQTAANVSIVSGSGQIYCSCPTIGGFANGAYSPLVVLVTDAFNRPVANATVNWSLTSSTFGFTGYVQNSTTTTGADSTSSNTFIPQGGAQLSGQQPISFQVTASSGNGAAVFSLSQAFDANGGAGSIGEDNTNIPSTSNTQPLSGTQGQQGYSFNGVSGQSFRVGVLTQIGTPVPGVSVRIENFQSSPTASCVTGPGADPGAVLTDSTGYATCTPVFSGSGPGSFLLVIGGVVDPANPGPLASNLLYYYYSVPPTQFMTVTAAVPSSINIISGNGQQVSAGSQVSQPLIASVMAQNGGTLSGQGVTWSVSPSNAGTLGSTTGTSDQNGQVSNT